MMKHDAPPVLLERRGRLGLITLNRPRALNALTSEMLDIIVPALLTWREDPEICTVAVRGSGERGLCAGGDVIALYEDASAGGGSLSAAFWSLEYQMNSLIDSYPKPFVALQDGIVLGGGIGISAHGSHRVVTERSKLGFPEVTIGYFPDVGATWLLPRAPGELGTRIALSAETIGATDAVLLGLADAFVPSERLPGLLTALETQSADDAISRLAQHGGEGEFAAQRDWIDKAFAHESVPEILAALHGHGSAEAQRLAATISAKSPTALSVTLAALRRGRSFDSLDEALAMEFRVSLHFLKQHDFREGIRAQLVDKDRNPTWRPATFDEVSQSDIEGFFEPSPLGELDLGPSA